MSWTYSKRHRHCSVAGRQDEHAESASEWPPFNASIHDTNASHSDATLIQNSGRARSRPLKGANLSGTVLRWTVHVPGRVPATKHRRAHWDDLGETSSLDHHDPFQLRPLNPELSTKASCAVICIYEKASGLMPLFAPHVVYVRTSIHTAPHIPKSQSWETGHSLSLRYFHARVSVVYKLPPRTHQPDPIRPVSPGDRN